MFSLAWSGAVFSRNFGSLEERHGRDIHNIPFSISRQSVNNNKKKLEIVIAKSRHLLGNNISTLYYVIIELVIHISPQVARNLILQRINFRSVDIPLELT